ncbi:MAG: MIP/aquaporin family protein [Bacteroidota bacterium]
MSPFVAEIVGTMILMLFGTGVNANVSLNKTTGSSAGWIVITLGWGMAVFVGVIVSQDYSGAHLNPAVTLGLAAAGKFAWELVFWYILAQFIGAMIGSTIAWAMYSQHFNATDDPAAQLGAFSTGPAISHLPTNLLSEIVGTFALVFVVLYITGPSGFMPADPSAPVGLGSVGALPVGLLVLAIGLCLGGPTGYAINPARDLGPRILHSILPIRGKGPSNWGYAWIPVVGPMLGALVAAGLFLGLS